MKPLYHVTKDDSALSSIGRSKAHLDQILHWAGISFLARFDGKILLQRRGSINKFQTALPWFGPGGKILSTQLFRYDDQAAGTDPGSE